MLQHLRPAFVLLTLFTLILGIGYPLAITGVSQAVLPHAANGSPIVLDGVVVGSELIGQNFTSARYFHARPSATGTPYDAANSSGSNLGPLSQKLIDRVKADIAAQSLTGAIPADAVETSGSGLDPHISPAYAFAQVARIARERNLAEAQVMAKVSEFIEDRLLGIVGETRVNVLKLNIALDTLAIK